MECAHRSSSVVVKVCSEPNELILADLQLHCCGGLRLSICGFCGYVLHGNLIHQVPKEAVLHGMYKLQQKRADAKVPLSTESLEQIGTLWHNLANAQVHRHQSLSLSALQFKAEILTYGEFLTDSLLFHLCSCILQPICQSTCLFKVWFALGLCGFASLWCLCALAAGL